MAMPESGNPHPAFKKWQCVICGFIYDEAAGLPDHGIAAGTLFSDLPADWVCPECGSPKSSFEEYAG